jgi:Concanavalin A-like lectin/glucanases superfamily
VTATPPKASLVKSTALVQGTLANSRLNSLMPTVPSAFSPVTVYQAGTLGVGGQLNAPTSLFPAGAGYYGVWVAPDLNNGKNYTVQVECFGGGGGGGGGSSTTGGGGGGGGEYACEAYYPVKPGTSYVWQTGVPGSPGTANSSSNQAATAGGVGGTTIFDIAGTGVAGGVIAHGGTGGDLGNTGLGGTGGSGSGNTIEFAGGPGGTDLPGGGGGSGGQGGTDNPVSLFTAGLLTATPVAWYIMNDASSTGALNDATGNNNTAQPGSYAGGGFAYAQGTAPTQVPAYTAGANPPSSPNPTVAAAMLQWRLAQLNQQSGYVLCPGFAYSGSSLTVSCWVTPDPTGTWGNTAAGSVAMIACNNEIGSPGIALYFKQNGTPANPNWQLTWYCANSSSSQTVTVSVPPAAGTPVYVVATFSSGSMKLYVNGTSAGTATASFTSIPGWPTVPYGITIGADPKIFQNWFFGFMSNVWFADGVLSAAGVTQAFSGSGGSSTNGGAGGGASGGPAAAGGAGAAGSGSTGGAGGTPAAQPAADIGINTPASAGIAGAASGSGNAGITGAPGAGGGGAGQSSSPPPVVTVQVPFTTAASYCGTDALGSASSGPLTGSLTSPAAGAAVSPVLTFSQAGTYTVYWSASLSGTLSGTDANNFAVKLNGATAATSVNASTAGAYPQAPFTVTVNAGDTLDVTAVATATSGAVYTAAVSAAGGGAAGAVYNPVIQGTTGRLFTGGQASDIASGSKNSLLILPPNLTAVFKGNTVLRVTLTVFNASTGAAQNSLMQVGWSGDTFLPLVYGGGNIAGSAGVVEIPLGASSVTADLTESQLGTYLANGGATALVLGPGFTPGVAAYNGSTAADFYNAVYGPGAVDRAGNSLSPYLTVTYAQGGTVQQGAAGGAGGIRVTYLNQGETLVGTWNSATGLSAQGGQLTETSIVLGSSTVKNGGRLLAAALDEPEAFPGFTEEQKETIRGAFSELLGARLGGGIPGAPGLIAGYTGGTTTVTQSTPGSYTFTVPAGVTSLNVQCWGAGAGATGGSTGTGQGGGGGGAYAGEPNYTVVPGQVLHYTVGAGGTGDHVGSNNAPDGGASIFDSTHVAGSGVTANGGQHYQGNLNYGPGGTTAGNTVSFAGGNGGPLQNGQVNGTGGGGSGGSTGTGGGGSQGGRAGAAGSGGGAAGGAGVNNGSGNGGSAPGGGGGGASRGTSSFTGGSGAAGEVMFSYASTTSLATSIATASGTDGAGNTYPAGVMTNALAVNGTATATTTTVSGTTTTNVLSVTTNASVGGNHTVTGNVAVGGVITGSGGGTLESSSSFHTSGTVIADSQVLVAGVSSGASVAGTNAHFTSVVQADGGFSGPGLVTGGQSVSGWPISVGSGSVGPAQLTTGLANALNSLYNAMVSSGLV